MEQTINTADIVKDLIEGKIDKKTLSEDVRRQCVEYLDHETDYSDQKIAEILGVGRTTVHRDKVFLKDQALQNLAPFETVHYAQEITILARKLQGMARKKGAYMDVWKIEMDLAEKLGRMGVIYFKGDPINLQVHIGDKKETNVTAIAIGEGGIESLVGAVNREIEEINRLQEFLKNGSN